MNVGDIARDNDAPGTTNQSEKAIGSSNKTGKQDRNNFGNQSITSQSAASEVKVQSYSYESRIDKKRSSRFMKQKIQTLFQPTKLILRQTNTFQNSTLPLGL